MSGSGVSGILTGISLDASGGRRLVSAGPASATTLAGEFPMTRQAVAKHLGVLRDAGLVERKTVGREARFQAAPEALGDVRNWIDQVGSQWDQRLARLRDRLD